MRLASTSSHRSRASRFARISLAAVLTLSLSFGALRADPTCSWLDDFEVAYERGDVAAYGALLAPQFRFHFGDAENRRRRPQGWDRDEELASYTNIHRGVVRPDGTKLPRAESIDVQFAGVRIGPDPEVPGSADHLLAFVHAATLDIRFADGRHVVDTAPHAFHLVRGRAIGRTGDAADEWFARTWIERPTDAPLLAAIDPPGVPVAAADAEGGLATQGDPDVPAMAGMQAALPRRGMLWPNPVRAGRGVSLAFDLVSTGLVALEVFDVRGRAVAAVAAQFEAPGRRMIRWDGRETGGRTAPAGIYFVRARLGDRDAGHRVVVID